MIIGRHIVGYVIGQRLLVRSKKIELCSKIFSNANSKYMCNILQENNVTANDTGLLYSLNVNEANSYFIQSDLQTPHIDPSVF